jgi:hypothetical protein
MLPGGSGAVIAAAGDLRGDARYESGGGIWYRGSPLGPMAAARDRFTVKGVGSAIGPARKGDRHRDYVDSPHRSRASMLIGALIRALMRLFRKKQDGSSKPTRRT